MAVKRVVDVFFWDDYRILDELSIEDRYFYLFLLTNPNATQVGIYPLPLRTIAHKTGFGREVVYTLLERFEKRLGLIKYNFQTQEVTVLESLRYSIVKGGPQLISLMEKELNRIKDTQLIEATLEYNEQYFDVSSKVFNRTLKEMLIKEIKRRQQFELTSQKYVLSGQKFEHSLALEEAQMTQKQNLEPPKIGSTPRRNLQVFDVNNPFNNAGLGQFKKVEKEMTLTSEKDIQPFSLQTFAPQTIQQDEDVNDDVDVYVDEDENEDQKLKETVPFTHSFFTTINQSCLEDTEAAEIVSGKSDGLKDFIQYCQERNISFPEPQLNSYREWLEKLPVELLIESVRRSLGKQNIFTYSMKILWNWHENGITSLASIKLSERKPKRNRIVKSHELTVSERLDKARNYIPEVADEEELKRNEVKLRAKLSKLLSD